MRKYAVEIFSSIGCEFVGGGIMILFPNIRIFGWIFIIIGIIFIIYPIILHYKGKKEKVVSKIVPLTDYQCLEKFINEKIRSGKRLERGIIKGNIQSKDFNIILNWSRGFIEGVKIAFGGDIVNFQIKSIINLLNIKIDEVLLYNKSMETKDFCEYIKGNIMQMALIKSLIKPHMLSDKFNPKHLPKE